MQLSINETLMATAILWSQQSHAKRKKVGAVISNKGRIVSVGYNGTLPGENNCCEDENGVTKITVRHAEENAFSHCLINGIKTQGCDLYVTLSPCQSCACSIIYAGISRVFYLEKYRDDKGLKLLEENNIQVTQLSEYTLSKKFSTI